jgi:hypothetical protein
MPKVMDAREVMVVTPTNAVASSSVTIADGSVGGDRPMEVMVVAVADAEVETLRLPPLLVHLLSLPMDAGWLM